MKSPVVKPPPLTSFFGKKRKRREANESANLFSGFSDGLFSEDDFFDEEFDDYDDSFDLSEGSEDDSVEYYSVALYPETYCSLVNDLQYACMELSILELWANDGIYDSKTDQEIASLTEEDVLNKVNGQNKSGVFLIERNFTEYLSNIKRDPTTGRIIGAEATIMRWWEKRFLIFRGNWLLEINCDTFVTIRQPPLIFVQFTLNSHGY